MPRGVPAGARLEAERGDLTRAGEGAAGAQGGGAQRAMRALAGGGLEVALAVQRRGEGHVVQSTRHGVGARVGAIRAMQYSAWSGAALGAARPR